MNLASEALQHVSYSLSTNEYIWSAIEKVAMFGTCDSEAEWKELLITACAFLNSNGGVIIIGIEDDEFNYRYVFKGFDTSKLADIKRLGSAFSDATGNPLKLSSQFAFKPEPFNEGTILVIEISALPADKKYALDKNIAWQRTKSGNQRALSVLLIPENEQKAGSVNETDTSYLPPEEPLQTIVQEIYSGELIALFGSDYISLEPECKQLLSFVYQCNHAPQGKDPSVNDICERLFAIFPETSPNKVRELIELRAKKTIAQMEKNGFLVKEAGRQGYKLNSNYTVARNLFN